MQIVNVGGEKQKVAMKIDSQWISQYLLIIFQTKNKGMTTETQIP